MMTLKSSLSKKLLVSIFLISSLVTLVVTFIQLAFDYHQDVSLLEQDLTLIQTTQVPGLSRSLWNLDEHQTRIQLQGLLNIPGVKYVDILTEKGSHIRIGDHEELASMKTIKREFLLSYKKGSDLISLGSLRVVASLEHVFQKLFNKIFVIFFTQLVKTFCVSFLIYLAIQRSVTRHLIKISKYLKNFNVENRPRELRLDRDNREAHDEFDILTNSINDMRTSLLSSYDSLARFNEELEKMVEEKTKLVVGQRQKLEYAAKMKALGEMAGGVAHEINNPLAIIQLNAEQLSNSLQRKNLDAGLLGKNAEMIIKTTERIAKIIRGLKFFARDNTHEAFIKVSLKDLFDDTLGLCGERLKSRGVEMRVIPIKEKIEFEGQPVHLSQVLINLISNAFDAVQSSQEKWIALAHKIEGGDLIISVMDSGPGIPEAIRDRIMQPFFTTKEVGKGTGLGLSISQGIMKAHQGDLFLDVSSRHTCFVLRLPFVQKKRLAA
jgi:C4-dicarboxylate-specific signal transduction histidine kinase